jgi:hypothetical protein
MFYTFVSLIMNFKTDVSFNFTIMNINLYFEIEMPEKTLNIELIGDVIEEDQGIGSYEFWGSRGFDSKKAPVLNSLTYNKSDFTEEENAFIQRTIDLNVPTIEENILTKYEKEK